MSVLLAVGLLASAGFVSLSGQSSVDIGAVLRVQSVVKMRDSRSGGEQSLRVGYPLRLGQTIRTGKDSGVEMSFDGDGRLLLWHSTRVELQQPGPPGERHPDCRKLPVAARIELLEGWLQVDHDPQKAHLNPRVLEVVTPDARICLFGTSIQVLADPDRGATGVYVQETGARVQHLDDNVNGDWLELNAGYQTLVRKGEKLKAKRSKQLTLPPSEGEGRFLDSPLSDLFVF